MTGDTVVACIMAQNIPLTEVEELKVDENKTKHMDIAAESFDSDNAEEMDA